MFYIKPSQARGWRTLGEPLLLADLRLESVGPFSVDNTVEFTSTGKGELNGVLIFFELELSPTMGIPTHPARADRACSWRNPVWVVDPLHVRPAQCLAVTYRYQVGEARHFVNVSLA